MEIDEDTIDLRSDTVTTPSEAMREAARDAEVGDDVYRDDPTVNELERRAADAVGTEARCTSPPGRWPTRSPSMFTPSPDRNSS